MDFTNPDAIETDGQATYGEAGSVKKRILVLGALVLVLLLIILAVVVTTRIFFASADRPTNLVVMLGDGFGPAQLAMARLMTPNGRLFMDNYFLGHISTKSATGPVTDSAAGATAYSCGNMTYNGAIAVTPDGKPCATLLEAAIHAGMKTGLVVTSEILDATPAAFAAHAQQRTDYDFIANQMLQSRHVDLILGGGRVRIEEMGLFDYARSNFANFVENADQLEQSTSLPLLGLFSRLAFPFSIDQIPEMPSLAQMTEKALQLLPNKKGFFLLVEGSRIDHAAHNNDPAAMVGEVLAFDAAIATVLEYAEQNENTLVIVVADHETGGVTIGRDGTYAFNTTALGAITRSIEYLTSTDVNPNGCDANSTVSLVQQYAAGIFLPGDERLFVNVTNCSQAASILSQYFSLKTRTGWTTNGHTGVDVSLFSYGIGITNFIGGLTANFQVGRTLASIMSFDLPKLTRGLTIDVSTPAGQSRDFTHSLIKDKYHTQV